MRGPSRSGKTAVCERLAEALEANGYRTAYIKRTHHPLDLPEKASGRVWAKGPSAMVILTPDRLQVTTRPVAPTAARMLAALPAGIDVALFETHTAEDFPTILAQAIEPAEGEDVVGRWHLSTLDLDIPAIIAAAFEVVAAARPARTNARGVCS
ncbi:MAG: molybdopterin-guanine dinucleotide biosynthesis protein MobB [Chloroflexi bacterium]|nr:molybdopterin-guanine dinucleotide biosynthesis protein MobB [Chloroflexota bacterium]